MRTDLPPAAVISFMAPAISARRNIRISAALPALVVFILCFLRLADGQATVVASSKLQACVADGSVRALVSWTRCPIPSLINLLHRARKVMPEYQNSAVNISKIAIVKCFCIFTLFFANEAGSNQNEFTVHI